MIHTSRKVRWTVIIISAWTITQSIIHLFWVLYAYFLSMCWIKPTYYDVVFVYLTYLYKKSCGLIPLKNETLFLSKTAAPEDAVGAGFSLTKDETSTNRSSKILYQFLNDTLTKAVLPHQSNGVDRTELYLGLLIIADMVWIVSTVFLFVGAFCKVKQKILSIMFYGPWLMCAAFVNFLDVVSAVQYGLDLVNIRSYTSWLEFIGVTNFEEFEAFNDDPSSTLIPTLPTTVVVALLCRVFLVWLVNVVSFFVILFLAIPDLFLRTTARPGGIRSSLSSDNKSQLGDEIDLNSTEARIRNWQLFYGAIEANSTMASDSSPGTSSARTNGDACGTEDSSNEAAGARANNYYASEKSTLDQKSDASSPESGLRRLSSDVASGVSTMQLMQDPDPHNINIPVLKGHIPWSYINPEGHYVPKHRSYSTGSVGKVVDSKNTFSYRTTRL